MQEFLSQDTIRDIVGRIFRQLAHEQGDASEPRATLSFEPAPEPTETVLIRDGYYYGHAFRAEGMVAKLIAATGMIEFIGPGGILLREMSLEEMALSASADAPSKAA